MSKSKQQASPHWSTRLLSLPHHRYAPLVAGGLAFVVYLITMPPVYAWGYDYLGRDGGDFITAAWSFGVPHPTGYPTYMLMARLFIQLPLGTIAWRVSLLSGLTSASTVGVLYVIIRRLIRPTDWSCDLAGWGAAVGALLLAFAPLFWAHALIAEVYALHVLVIALVVWLMLRWRDGEGALWPAALTFGLGMGNHVTLTFLAPAVLLLLWSGRDRLNVRGVALAALALLAGLSVYAYVPWRASADPLINWGGPSNWDGFKWLVTGHAYRRFFFALPGDQLAARLDEWWARSSDQFPLLAWPLAIIGLWELSRRDRWLALATVVHAALSVVYSTFYDTTDAYVYLLPTFFYMALWAGIGAGFLMAVAYQLREPGWRSAAATAVVTGGLLLLPLISLAQEWPSMDQTHDRRAREYAQEALGAVEPGALILVSSDVYTFTLWYYHYVEGMRPDVLVVNQPMLTFDWYQRTVAHHNPEVLLPNPTRVPMTKRNIILANLVQRPVYVTEDEDDLPDLELTPVGPLWRVTLP